MKQIREESDFSIGFLCFIGICILAAIIFWVGIAYVAIHFISKWW